MDLNQLVDARSAYAYPAGSVSHKSEARSPVFENLIFHVPINGASELFPSSIDLDKYHNGLLNSEDSNQIYLGIASVQYWGRCSVKNRLNHAQAQERTKWLFNGNARSDKTIVKLNSYLLIKDAITFIKDGAFGSAYLAIKNIPHIGPSFGSKLLAFLSPENIGVYDSHIARYLSQNIECIASLVDWNQNDIFILPDPKSYRSKNTQPFQNYCLLLKKIAARLNAEGSAFFWRDWDESINLWRAVDVERALFQIAQMEHTTRG